MSKIKYIITYEFDESDFSDLMENEDLTLLEAVQQEIFDGVIDLNDHPISNEEFEEIK